MVAGQHEVIHSADALDRVPQTGGNARAHHGADRSVAGAGVVLRKPSGSTSGGWKRGDNVLGDIFAAVLVVGILLGPLAIFGWSAVTFGVDSRPGLGEREPRPWL
jgi:hypothetical protein